eukprot:snap_masked-scaffold_3-processed-gene-4.32-mRNA-1 protein AED:1.00 eAED:1.00 QI:0/0/0/0/1/1/2/0/65
MTKKTHECVFTHNLGIKFNFIHEHLLATSNLENNKNKLLNTKDKKMAPSIDNKIRRHALLSYLKN